MEKLYFPLVKDVESRLPFILRSIGISNNQDHTKRPEGYPYFHWLHCRKGEGLLLVNGHEYTLAEGTAFFLYPGVPHEYYSVVEPWETRWLTFDGFAVPELLKKLDINSFEMFRIKDEFSVDRLMDDICLTVSGDSSVIRYDTSVLLYKFILEIKNYMDTFENRSKNTNISRLKPLVDMISENYSKPVSLEDMAKLAGVSPHHLCRLFKKTYNMRPFTYLTGFRIQRAKEMLVEHKGLKIKEIAERTGFSDTSYFCTLFRKFERITPEEFRRIHS